MSSKPFDFRVSSDHTLQPAIANRHHPMSPAGRSLTRITLLENQSRLLVGADLLTGGQMLHSTAVLLQGGKVLALGKAAERMGQAHGAKRVDLSDHYLSPGFIDLHTHGVAGVDFVTASRE